MSEAMDLAGESAKVLTPIERDINSTPYYAEVPLTRPRSDDFSGDFSKGGVCYHEDKRLAIFWRYGEGAVEVSHVPLDGSISLPRDQLTWKYTVNGVVRHVEGMLYTYMEEVEMAPFQLTIVYEQDDSTYFTRKHLGLVKNAQGVWGLYEDEQGHASEVIRVCQGEARAACVTSGTYKGVPLSQVSRRSGPGGNQSQGGLAVVVGQPDGTVVVAVDSSKPITINTNSTRSSGGWLPSFISKRGEAVQPGQGIACLAATTITASDGTQENHLVVINDDFRLMVYVWKTTGTEQPRLLLNESLRPIFQFDEDEDIDEVQAILLSGETMGEQNSLGCWRLSVYAKTSLQAKFIGIAGDFLFGEKLNIATSYVVNGIPPASEPYMELSCFGRGAASLWASWIVRANADGPAIGSRVFVTDIGRTGMGNWHEITIPGLHALRWIPQSQSVKVYVLDKLFGKRGTQPHVDLVFRYDSHDVAAAVRELIPSLEYEDPSAVFRSLLDAKVNDDQWLDLLHSVERRDYVLGINTTIQNAPTIFLVRKAGVSVVRMVDKLELLYSDLTVDALNTLGTGDNWILGLLSSVKRVQQAATQLGDIQQGLMALGPMDSDDLMNVARDKVQWHIAGLTQSKYKLISDIITRISDEDFKRAAEEIMLNCSPDEADSKINNKDEIGSTSLGLQAVASAASQFAALRLSACLDVLMVGLALLSFKPSSATIINQNLNTAAALAVKLRPMHWLATTRINPKCVCGANAGGENQGSITLGCEGCRSAHNEKITVMEAYLQGCGGNSPETAVGDLQVVTRWPGPNAVRAYANIVLQNVSVDCLKTGALKECYSKDLSCLSQYGYQVEAFLANNYWAELKAFLLLQDKAIACKKVDDVPLDYQALSDWLKGCCVLKLHNPDEAVKYFNQAITAVWHMSDVISVVELNYKIADQYRDSDNNTYALEFARAGLRLLKTMGSGDNEPLEAKLSQVQLLAGLDTGDYDSACSALSRLRQIRVVWGPMNARKTEETFIKTLWQRGEGARLCRYVLAEGTPDWTELFEGLAKNKPVSVNEPHYYELLYSLHIARNDYKSASVALYSLAARLNHVQPTMFVLERKCKALAGAINALSLVPQKAQWIAVKKDFNDRSDRRSPKRDNYGAMVTDDECDEVDSVQMVDLASLRLALLLARTKILLVSLGCKIQDLQSILPSGLSQFSNDTLGMYRQAVNDETNIKLYNILMAYGLYDWIFNIHLGTQAVKCRFHPGTESSVGKGPLEWSETGAARLPLCEVFEDFTSTCINIALHGDELKSDGLKHNQIFQLGKNSVAASVFSECSPEKAWALLKSYLQRFDGRNTNYAYHICVARRLLIQEYPVPSWLVHLFKESGEEVMLIRTYLDAGKWVDACGLLISYLDRMALLYQTNVQSIGIRSDVSGWLPWQLINRVLASLKAAEKQEEQAQIQAQTLKKKLLLRLSDSRFPQDEGMTMDIIDDPQGDKPRGVQAILHTIADIAENVIS